MPATSPSASSGLHIPPARPPETAAVPAAPAVAVAPTPTPPPSIARTPLSAPRRDWRPLWAQPEREGDLPALGLEKKLSQSQAAATGAGAIAVVAARQLSEGNVLNATVLGVGAAMLAVGSASQTDLEDLRVPLAAAINAGYDFRAASSLQDRAISNNISAGVSSALAVVAADQLLAGNLMPAATAAVGSTMIRTLAMADVHELAEKFTS
jgi:hypothetical protein